jgi:hypothetical protein
VQLLAALLSLSAAGCLDSRYEIAPKDTPRSSALNLAFPATAPLHATLVTVIVYEGAGSWKRKALWDEYVLELRNVGPEPVAIEAAALVDACGRPIGPGTDPWQLEAASLRLEKQYSARGERFVRTAGKVAFAIGPAAGGIAGASLALGSAGAAGAGVALALGSVIVLPIAGVTVGFINLHHKHEVEAEFQRRRLVLPLTLASGEKRTGSLFLPMVRSPHALLIQWASASERPAKSGGTSQLALGFLSALHVPVGTPASPQNCPGSVSRIR